MKIVYNSIIPFKGYSTINLFEILFVRKEYKDIFENNEDIKNRVINHEFIHTRQMREMLYIPYYIWYLIEFIVRLFQCKFYHMLAYRNISFEKEAYDNEHNKDYLNNRKLYSFIKYI